jgi:uncharacterized membrane protein YeaQ/YmgE (transglycosylase-associated protein family)
MSILASVILGLISGFIASKLVDHHAIAGRRVA